MQGYVGHVGQLNGGVKWHSSKNQKEEKEPDLGQKGQINLFLGTWKDGMWNVVSLIWGVAISRHQKHTKWTKKISTPTYVSDREVGGHYWILGCKGLFPFTALF